MQFRQIVYLVLLHLISSLSECRDCNNSSVTISKRTFYEKSFANLLKRKKRGFVFFKGSVVVLTQVLSKHIVARAPRGVIHSSEVDLFYDVPILIEGWKKPLEAFANRTKGSSKKKKDKIDDIFLNEDETTANVGVVNSSAIPWSGGYHQNLQDPNWKRLTFFKTHKNWNRMNYPYRRQFYRKPYQNYYVPNYQRRYYTNQIQIPKKEISFNRYPVHVKKYNQSNNFKGSSAQNNKKVNPLWYEHREYRERRGIFEHIEGFGKKLGISLRSCILRAICEIKTELLPQGESFINDVARILFTIPTNHDNRGDDFVQMALEDDVDCARRFMVSCPHSPLKYFHNNFKATNLPPMSDEDRMRSLMYAR